MRPTEDYAEYVRRLTGVAPPYVMFGFPDYIPVKAYVQTLPGMTTIFNFVKYVIVITLKIYGTVLTALDTAISCPFTRNKERGK